MQLGKSLAPFDIVVTAEHDSLVGRNRQPCILVDFSVELPGTPAGIAQGQETLAWAMALGNRLQYVKAGSQRHAIIDTQTALAGPVGRVKNKAARVIHRTTGA